MRLFLWFFQTQRATQLGGDHLPAHIFILTEQFVAAQFQLSVLATHAWPLDRHFLAVNDDRPIGLAPAPGWPIAAVSKSVSGHGRHYRLSTGGLEEVVASHPDVAECAVIGVADEIKGEVPLGLVVLKAGVARPAEEIAAELVQMVRERVGAIASFRLAAIVKRLPKTRSGKIVRGTIKKIADGQKYQVPATIDDPATLEEIAASLSAIGFPRRLYQR